MRRGLTSEHFNVLSENPLAPNGHSCHVNGLSSVSYLGIHRSIDRTGAWTDCSERWVYAGLGPGALISTQHTYPNTDQNAHYLSRMKRTISANGAEESIMVRVGQVIPLAFFHRVAILIVWY
jgi:hypothetical protein